MILWVPFLCKPKSQALFLVARGLAQREDSSIPTSWKQYKVHGKVYSTDSGCHQCHCKWLERVPYAYASVVQPIGSHHTMLMALIILWEFWRASLLMLSLGKLLWLLACLCKARLGSPSPKDLLFQVNKIQHPHHLLTWTSEEKLVER